MNVQISLFCQVVANSIFYTSIIVFIEACSSEGLLMKQRFYKVFIAVSIVSASVSLYIYLRYHIHSNNHIDFGDISRLSYLHNSNPINVIKICKEKHNFEKGVLTFDNKSLDMFLYGKHDLISQSIIEQAMWKAGWINQMIRYLKANPGMQLMDAGCNLGAYTLVAASLGHKVIAIDANKDNTDRLAQSVLINNLMDKVTIVLNVLSNERTFSMNTTANNVGGQELNETKNNSYRVESIFLDDLLPLLDRKDIMMKMDIQYHEIRAMKGASDLFDKRNIKLLLVKWVPLKNMADSYTFMLFLLSRRYTPHMDFFAKEELDRVDYQNWPDNVVWRRN